MTTATLPTLSQVRGLDVTYLIAAARDWAHTADLWEEAFTQIHGRLSSHGVTSWTGVAAAKAQQRAYGDMVKVRAVSYQLHEAAAIARRAGEQLQACKELAMDAVTDARAEGFDVGEHYAVTDRIHGGSAEFRAARRAQALQHAGFIQHRVATLVAADQRIAVQVATATEGIDSLSFSEGTGGIRLVDNHTFKDAPNPEPVPPPGGWSSDPLMRAAQKIAYGHASGPEGHMSDFPGMTKDQLAQLIYDKMKASIESPEGLRLGPSSSDGAPVIYDPRDNVLIVRDPNGADCGTVFKPDRQEKPNYVDGKFGGTVKSFQPSQLADEPIPAPAGPRLGPPAVREPVPPDAPVEVLPPGRLSPGISEGGQPMPRLPFGIGTPWDAPATGPHPIHIPHQHHTPLLGEPPD